MPNDTPITSHSHVSPLRQPPANRAAINGWGADLDRGNRPGVPMERTPPRLEQVPDGPPSQQPQHFDVFVSPERPGITPLFGTSAPPRGISGQLRKFAYKMTENDIRHWLLLLVADRVDVIEGLGDDLRQGKMPNLVDELGIRAEWQHNRAGLVRKAAIAAAVTGVGLYLLKRRRAGR
jgi:hypothetical protein